jgi:hypothetical protein
MPAWAPSKSSGDQGVRRVREPEACVSSIIGCSNLSLTLMTFSVRERLETRRHTQVARERSAKPLFTGSSPVAASKKIKGLANIADPFLILLLTNCYDVPKICSQGPARRLSVDRFHLYEIPLNPSPRRAFGRGPAVQTTGFRPEPVPAGMRPGNPPE